MNISLKFVPKGLINNIPALVQIMDWCRPGDKALSEPMMISLLTHYASLGLKGLMQDFGISDANAYHSFALSQYILGLGTCNER